MPTVKLNAAVPQYTFQPPYIGDFYFHNLIIYVIVNRTIDYKFTSVVECVKKISPQQTNVCYGAFLWVLTCVTIAIFSLIS